MLNYLICQIKGKQYKVLPNQPFQVGLFSKDDKRIEADVLLQSEDGKLQIGKPFLKQKVALDVLGEVKGKKIRVAKFHAKANYRKTTGLKPRFTQVVLTVKKNS